MLYASPEPGNTTIGLLMIGNTLRGLTSLVSDCIGRMHVYEYGDNINNPYWIIHPVCKQGTVQSGGASVMTQSAVTGGKETSHVETGVWYEGYMILKRGSCTIATRLSSIVKEGNSRSLELLKLDFSQLK
ncbi:hypothetical protein AVEN_187040-1 [Araneus ventricosus]|uniref:Uncharacterized protein n=1 Tax=Araneus ventricosus TaxID=182803 RepID=A0A4Y2PS94_ARAVE|nr:hypothetical protein AVEN_187040-1 [Araneus ventricosus]